MKNILLSSAIITTLSLFSVTQGLAQTAFGLTLGQTLPDDATPSSNNGQYRLTPPKTHSLFDFYNVYYHEDHGICSITAFGKDNEDDKYGTDVKSQYNKIKNSLIKKYKNNEAFRKMDEIEFLKAGALYDEDDEFAVSIEKDDRYHETYWKLEDSDLEEIQLRIRSIRYQATYIQLSYYSSFDKECHNSIDAADEDSL